MRTKVIAGLVAASLVSATGVVLVMNHEGLRLHAYPDPASALHRAAPHLEWGRVPSDRLMASLPPATRLLSGHPWTICYGHTRYTLPGMSANLGQCEIWLREDVAIAEAGLRRLVRVPLSQPEYDAYTSFIFNVGESRFSQSTMLRLLNANERRAACNQFPRWRYANRMVLNGLIKRRYDEQRLCLTFTERYVYVPR